MPRTSDRARPRVATPAGARRLLPVAISANGDHMLMYFTDIADAMLKVHGVDPTFRNAMNSRLKHFQLQGFPLAVRSREKARVGMDDALKLAFAFELLAVGISPIRAARLTRTDWPVLSEAIAAAWWRLQQPEGSRADRRDVAIAPNALAEFGAKETLGGVPLSETIGALTSSEVAKSSARRLLLVDVGEMVVSLGVSLRGVQIDEFDRAMRLYCAEVFGSDRPGDWQADATERSAPATKSEKV